MKKTDFVPRASEMLVRLTGQNLVGAEFGAGAGAHAHALLQYCDIKFLYLVDIWDNPYVEGYCTGRLHAAGYRSKVKIIKADALKINPLPVLDFVYIDMPQDYKTIKEMINFSLMFSSLIVVRGYGQWPGLTKACNEYKGTGRGAPESSVQAAAEFSFDCLGAWTVLTSAL